MTLLVVIWITYIEQKIGAGERGVGRSRGGRREGIVLIVHVQLPYSVYYAIEKGERERVEGGMKCRLLHMHEHMYTAHVDVYLLRVERAVSGGDSTGERTAYKLLSYMATYTEPELCMYTIHAVHVHNP